jgi:hypothetical protein
MPRVGRTEFVAVGNTGTAAAAAAGVAAVAVAVTAVADWMLLGVSGATSRERASRGFWASAL